MYSKFKSWPSVSNICGAVIASIIYFWSGNAFAIFKCISLGGGVTFQDTPCPGAGSAYTPRPAMGSGDIYSAEKAHGETRQIEKKLAIRAAIHKREALVGMTMAELNEAMGLPSRVNTRRSVHSESNQLVYERAGQTVYVYTDGKFVSSVSSHDSSSSRQTVQCPSGHEIRNARTAANSTTLSAEEKERKLKTVQQMEACGR